MSTLEPFQPNFIWRSGHWQTIYRGTLRRTARVEWHRYRLATDYGDSLAVDMVSPVEAVQKRLLILHGITGCSGASPIPDIALRLRGHGVETHVLHLRGADRVCPPIPRLYHAGCSDDLQAVFSGLPQDLPWRFVGFSLGANLLLKWLGENPPIPNATALAVSCPFDLAQCAENLEASFFPRLYRFVLIRRLLSLIKPFRKRFPEHLTHNAEIRTFFDFDEHITARLHGFAGARAYWEACSARGFLGRIEIPTTLLHASDDPFQPSPPVNESNPHLTWEVYPHGGHVGFQESWRKDWLLERIVYHATS